MLTNTYVAILAISFLCSLISFRLHFPFHLKLFSTFIGIALCTELLAGGYGPSILHFENNLPIYNIYRLFEFCGTAYYYKLIISQKSIQKIINGFLIVYPIFWVISVFFVFGIDAWNSNLAVVGGAFIIFLSTVYCYRLFVSEELIVFRRCAEFWIAIALIIFYATMLPITGMFYYLTAHFGKLANQLVDLLQMANILMYSLFIYAFLCRISTTRKSSQ